MSQRILDGLRIIDLSYGLAGPVAAQLLAEAGADVIKVEAPAGDPLRSAAAFATWNRSKRGITIDLGDAADRDQLETLLGSADGLIHGLRPSVAARYGLDDVALAARFPQLVWCSVLGFPAHHPDAERPGYDLLVQARAGMMDEQLGWRDGPIPMRFPLGSWAAAYLAAAGLVTRLLMRRRTGHGGGVHTSLWQGMLNTVALVWNNAENPSPALLSTKYDIPQQIAMYRCSDGDWLQLMNPGERIDVGALTITQEVLAELGDPGHPVDAVRLRRAFAYRTSEQWLDALRAADVAVEPAVHLGDILRLPEIEENNLVVDVEDPVFGVTRQANSPIRTEPPSRVTRPAPRLGEHNAEVAAERRPAPSPALAAELIETEHPLTGLKVVDLGAFLAGPMAPMLLGDMGADVIKVEPLVGDRMRFMANYFEACSRGKRSIALDISTDKGRAVLDRLVRWADVVHHNQRRKAAGKLGIDDKGLRQHNPDVVFGYVSAYGEVGRRVDWPGFDSVFEALGGWELENAGAGNPPLFSRFGALDVQCALSSLVGTLLALYHREHTDSPGMTHSSLIGATSFSTSETLIKPDGSLADYIHTTADQTGLATGYRIWCTADDEWIAVVAPSAEALATLRAVAGGQTDEEMEAGLRGQAAADVLAALEAANVPCELVRVGHMYEFMADPVNQATRLVVDYPHSAYTRMQQPGAYWNFTDLELKLEHGSPVVGEHSTQILRELGYDDAEVAGLFADGIVGGS